MLLVGVGVGVVWVVGGFGWWVVLGGGRGWIVSVGGVVGGD